MTERERYLETVLFGSPDKIPFMPGNPRKSTLERWHKEGLPQDREWFEVLCEEIGMAPQPPNAFIGFGVNFRMMPTFEEKVLEHRDGHYIVQDWMGNVTEISDEYDYTYIRNAIDFVTRKWHKFPVESRDDFEQMKKRYDPQEQGRFPDDFREHCDGLRKRNTIVSVSFSGPFWQLREWVGFEPLCMLFVEDPEFIREMISFWAQFISDTLAPILDEGILDAIQISLRDERKQRLEPATHVRHVALANGVAPFRDHLQVGQYVAPVKWRRIEISIRAAR